MSDPLGEIVEIFRDESAGWPRKALLALDGVESRDIPDWRRPREPRARYRVTGTLTLFSQPERACGWLIYTRDVQSRALGFVCSDNLTLGHGGIVRLCNGQGIPRNIYCVVQRCRPLADGWHEGVLSFNRQQSEFDPPILNRQATQSATRLLFR
jgi:hypothetical protein